MSSLATMTPVLAFMLGACTVSNPPRPAPPGVTAEQRPGMLLRLGDDMLRDGDSAGALRLYQSARQAAPNEAAPLIHIGDALGNLDDAPRAEQAFRGALVLVPGDADAQRGLALALIAQGRAREALPLLQELDKGTTDIRVLRAEGTAFDLLGQPGRAQAIYRRALQQAPVDAALHGNLALSLALSGNKDAALGEIMAAMNSPAPDSRQDANAVLVLALAGRMSEARQRGAATIGLPATEVLVARASRADMVGGHARNPAAVGVLTGTNPQAPAASGQAPIEPATPAVSSPPPAMTVAPAAVPEAGLPAPDP